MGFAMREQVTDVKQLEAFREDGFTFDAELSTSEKLVFVDKNKGVGTAVLILCLSSYPLTIPSELYPVKQLRIFEFHQNNPPTHANYPWRFSSSQ